MNQHRSIRTAAVVLAAILLAASCVKAGNSSSSSATSVSEFNDPGDCMVIDMTVSSEKIQLIKSLAKTFNAQRQKLGNGRCIFVRPQVKASGAAAKLLSSTWDEKADGPRPVIWSPAASSWGAILNQRLGAAGKTAMAPVDAKPFMLTPLVIAMPKPMADALGYPAKPVGWADILKLANSPGGWGAYGHPEWGPFRLGKTNPNFSTSGLSALIAQTYAATAKTSGLSTEDLNDPKVVAFSRGIESSVVHYGDITMTFLNSWFRADRRDAALTYASAVAIEEKSLIDYNLGNPDGVLDPGEQARPPKIPLVAIYPSEGTLYSDNPFYVLNAPWVDDQEKQAAAKFEEFLQQPANQSKVLESGFRPGNPNVKIDTPIVAANHVDAAQPRTLLSVPDPAVLVKLLDQWASNRKAARVLLVLDVSGSMGETVGQSGQSKLDLSKQAVLGALDQFDPNDEVGLRIFSTGVGPSDHPDFQDVQPLTPIGANKEKLRASIENLAVVANTPLFSVALGSYQTMLTSYDPARINAVILLTDGKNDDADRTDDRQQQQALINALRDGSQGEGSKPIRMFTVGYGGDADMATLKTISEASNAAAYNATDATTIGKVFTQVVSNF